MAVIKRSWARVLIGPLSGIVIAPIVSIPIIRLTKYILWDTGNHMPGKLFLGTVSFPIIASIYSVFFVFIGAMFAPKKRKETGTILFLLGAIISYFILWDFPSPRYVPGHINSLWKPFVFTLIIGAFSLVAVFIIESKPSSNKG